jgi:hypothetical protein
MFLVLMFCLQHGDAFAASFQEPFSSSSSAITRSSTDVAQNDVPTMEDESGGDDVMERVSSTAGAAAVVVATTNAALPSRNVFDGVDGAATTTIEMYQHLQKQHQQQQQQTERLKDENAQLRADRDQWRLHAIENGHIEPPISVGDSMTALVDWLFLTTIFNNLFSNVLEDCGTVNSSSSVAPPVPVPFQPMGHDLHVDWAGTSTYFPVAHSTQRFFAVAG